jgi:FixJ family two-component response regulator
MVGDDPRVREGLENLFDSVDIAVLTFSSAACYLEHSRVDDAACLIQASHRLRVPYKAIIGEPAFLL